MSKKYILALGDIEIGYEMVGPFDTYREASRFARKGWGKGFAIFPLKDHGAYEAEYPSNEETTVDVDAVIAELEK
jgi:hypothetical protein